MRCFCGRKQVDAEWANSVYDGVPCCNFACYAQAELVAKERIAHAQSLDRRERLLGNAGARLPRPAAAHRKAASGPVALMGDALY
jgi:hypothetical protein